MSPRRRASRIPLVSGPLGDLAAFLVGPGRTLALGLIVVTLFGGGWYWGWQHVKGDVLSGATYTLSPDDIIVTDRPEWMSFDLREKVFRDASLQQDLSIMDHDLNERITAAFSLQPWVAKVKHVRKGHPAGVVVDLEYRRPVCIVYTCGQPIPVDVEGNALPAGDIARSEIVRYPRMECPDLSTPRGPVGDQWGDPRVLGAARIADALGDRWRRYRLRLIQPAPPQDSGRSGGIDYVLSTHSHSEIRWGKAPGMEIPGEPTTAEKLAYLDGEMERYGNLEGANGWPRTIDVRAEIQSRRSGTPR
jgi:hypothetical protein